MRASVEQQKLLLSSQEQHTLLAKLRSEIAKLPEEDKLAELKQAQGELKKKALRAATLWGDAQIALKNVETELAAVKERLERQQGRLEETNQYDPKQIQSLEKEIAHMHSRIEALENKQLETLEQIEKLEEIKAKIDARGREYAEQIATLEASKAQKLAGLESQVREAESTLATLRGQIDPALLALFDEVRESSGGVGAVKLVGLQVEGGLDLQFSAAEAQAIRSAAPDEVLQSEEYEYILVRC